MDLVRAQSNYEQLEAQTAKRVLEFHQSRRNLNKTKPSLKNIEAGSVERLTA
jgi:hypothetical protein